MKKGAKIYLMINDSAADWSISVKFGIEFDHVTSDVLRSFRVNVNVNVNLKFI